MERNDEYLSDILFHFWPHDPPELGLRILKSIVERGLLLSRGSDGLIDRFPYQTTEGTVDFVEIVQNARVCFTDIPLSMIRRHSAQYGRMGVGFDRRTIISWGGCPVWYVPNHVRTGTMQDHVGASLFGIGQAVTLLKASRDCLLSERRVLTRNGAPMTAADTAAEFDRAIESVHRFGSYLKEMSGKESDDHRYLYEREWRIVSGLRYPGMDESEAPFRKLTDDEKKELCSHNPRWAEPMRSTDDRISNQFSQEPLIDSFWFLRGLSQQESLSRMIRKILVPDDSVKQQVARYLESEQHLFSDPLPAVEVLDGSEPRWDANELS